MLPDTGEAPGHNNQIYEDGTGIKQKDDDVTSIGGLSFKAQAVSRVNHIHGYNVKQQGKKAAKAPC